MRRWKQRGALAALASFAAGCLGVADVSRGEAHALVAAGALLLDVRSPAEFAERHPTEAVNIPLDQLPSRLRELGPRGRPIVVYCHTGMRAIVATRRLRAAGFAATRNLGPMGRWYAERVGPPATFE